MPRTLKYFFDTEFLEQPGILVPVSIGIVCEDGRELHLVSKDHRKHPQFDYDDIDPWVKRHVLNKLPPEETWRGRISITQSLMAFINEPILAAGGTAELRPQFWAYFASYDWVCFCWMLGGRMIDLPPNWPSFCMDLKQSMAERGMRETHLPSKNKKLQHDALEDARWLKRAYEAVFG